jgi:hypothetical protein
VAILSKFGGIASSGPTLLTDDPFVCSDNVIYVDSVTGSDTNAGTRREKPKATVFGSSGAFTVCTDGGSNVVVCLETHRETISSSYPSGGGLTFPGGVTLISLGSGSARAQFTSSVAGVAIDVTKTHVRFENLYFAASTAATTARIRASATSTGLEVRDCYFEIGASDYTDTILVNAQSGVRITGCTFKVTAAASSGSTQCGVRGTGAATDLLVEDCTFDGQSYGWTDNALDIDTGTADKFRIRSCTLQGYSYVAITATGTEGYIGGLTCDTTSGWSWVE